MCGGKVVFRDRAIGPIGRRVEAVNGIASVKQVRVTEVHVVIAAGPAGGVAAIATRGPSSPLIRTAVKYIAGRGHV